jgi:hypothetical protein
VAAALVAGCHHTIPNYRREFTFKVSDGKAERRSGATHTRVLLADGVELTSNILLALDRDQSQWGV